MYVYIYIYKYIYIYIYIYVGGPAGGLPAGRRGAERDVGLYTSMYSFYRCF